MSKFFQLKSVDLGLFGSYTMELTNKYLIIKIS